LIGSLLIKLGMAIVPAETRDLVRKMLLYHVPGALTEEAKFEVRYAKAVWALRHALKRQRAMESD
jgi:hypothetical protein